MVSTPLHWHYRRYDGAAHPLNAARFSVQKSAATSFIEHPLPAVAVSEPRQREIDRLARLVAKARGVIQWRRESGETEEIDLVQIEEPVRAQGQLRTLAEALAIIHGRHEVTDHEIELVRRVALSSMPADRAGIVALFPAHPEGLSLAAASESTRAPGSVSGVSDSSSAN